ncbi:hypothetical protein PG993_010228 [Apiospora rasikravindrae]|uniref:Uncharacterized protein n=1 Tax=Apiospora rasikravindrae TaxID=990691 RepID=A0ABR1SLM5_9PEZI
MAFSSANVDSLTMGMQGVAVGAADRCIPFLTNELTGISIKDSQDAYEDLQLENLAHRSPYLDDQMDWEETQTQVINTPDLSPTPAKVNPFLDTKVAAKPYNPFENVKPVIYDFELAAPRLPEEMDIDEWSINHDDHNDTVNNYNNDNNKARVARKRNNRGNQRNNQRQGKGNTTRSNNGGSNGTSNKSQGRTVGYLGNHKITKDSGDQYNNDSRSETRRGGNNHNHNNKSSRRRSNNGNKNRSQRQ